MELTTPRDEVLNPDGWEVTEDWHVDTASPGDVEGMFLSCYLVSSQFQTGFNDQYEAFRGSFDVFTYYLKLRSLLEVCVTFNTY